MGISESITNIPMGAYQNSAWKVIYVHDHKSEELLDGILASLSRIEGYLTEMIQLLDNLPGRGPPGR